MDIKELTDDNIFVALTNNKIDVSEIVENCTDPKGGCVNLFVGTTRDYFVDESGKKEVSTLSYEAEEELALMEMRSISEEAIEKFGCLKVIIVHRLGEVPVGGISIVVAVSTNHRPEGFKSTEWIMKDLKARVPLWKREIYSSGDSNWKVNKEYLESL